MARARIARRIAAAVALAAALALPAGATADDLSLVHAPDSPFATYDGSTKSTPHELATADIDGDGHDDVVASDSGYYGAHPRVWWGRAGGGLDPVPTSLSMPEHGGFENVAIADVAGGPEPDVVFASESIWVRPYAGGREFGPALPPVAVDEPEAGVHAANGLVTGDFDGDSDNDVAVTAESGDPYAPKGLVRIFTNSGGTLAHAQDLGDADHVGELAVGRFDDANGLDIAYAQDHEGPGGAVPSAGVLLDGDGPGVEFTQAPDVSGLGVPTDYPISRLVAADLDADGFDDLAASGGVEVAWADGDGTFSGPVTVDTLRPLDIRTGDLTGDGKLDIAAIGDPLRILTGTGPGRSFSLGLELDPPLGGHHMPGAVGDFDADPRDDLALMFDDMTEWDFYRFYTLLSRPPGGPDPFAAPTPVDPADDTSGGDPAPLPPPPTGAGPPGPPPDRLTLPPLVTVRSGQLVGLPPAARCLPRRRRGIPIRLRRPPAGVVVRDVRLYVNGRRVRVLAGATRGTVVVRRARRGVTRLKVRIALADGRVLRASRRLSPCARR